MFLARCSRELWPTVGALGTRLDMLQKRCSSSRTRGARHSGPDAPRGGEDLARTYEELVVTWPVLTAVIHDLKLYEEVDRYRIRWTPKQ